jgi:hypothetical protein
MNTKRLIKMLALLIAAIMCASALASCSLGNASKYRQALELTEQGDYEAAFALFNELGDYKDVAEIASRFCYLPTRIEDHYIDGEVENTVVYTFTYNENNLPSQRVQSFSDGYEHTCNYFYNEKGNVIKMSCSDTDALNSVTEITYNENDQQTSIKATYSDGYHYLYEYFYDEKGNLYKTTVEDDGEFTTYESFYDAENQITKQIQTDKDGNQLQTKEYFYDEKGNLIKITYTEMGTLTGFDEFTYDENDFRIREHYEETTGYILDTYYTYDANENMIEERIVDNDNYECTSKPYYKLVYIPFDYSDEEWSDFYNVLYYW